MIHVILAGGTGTRFWPLSRRHYPKQLLKILGEKSMIRRTYERLAAISPVDKVMVVASAELCEQIQRELPELSHSNFIIEPSGKNTAPAIALAAVHALSEEDEIMGVYPSDHLIRDEDAFRQAVSLAKDQVQDRPSLVTFGIPPTYPATGYGYIQYFEDKDGVHPDIRRVKTFAEKPELETAERFLRSGDFLWNSGMFVWSARILLMAMKTYMPDLYESMEHIGEAMGSPDYKEVLKREWHIIKPESIDYGILERAKNVYTVRAGFGWSDVGSWKSLFDILEKDENVNVLLGLARTMDTKKTLVISPDKLTMVFGLKNIAVINTEDATLVMPLKQAEKVKEIVQYLAEEGEGQFL